MSRMDNEIILANRSFSKSTKCTPTRKNLKEIACGNITVDEILNRAKFDSGFDNNKYTALIEIKGKTPLCYFFTCESGVCWFGTKCKYVHDSDIFLKSLDGRPVCPSGPICHLERIPFMAALNNWDQGTLNAHSISMIEYRGKVVWMRDGAESSLELWEKCQSGIMKEKAKLRAIASSVGNDLQSDPSVPEFVQLINSLNSSLFEGIFSYLPITDISNVILSFGSCSYVRNSTRGDTTQDDASQIFSPELWESVICSKWRLPYHHIAKPVQRFLTVKQSTLNSHTYLYSGSLGLYVHAKSTADQTPFTGTPAVTELDADSTYGRTILVYEGDNEITDIRFSDSLLACASVSELSVLRRGDLVKVGTCKQRSACEKVVIPKYSRGESLIVHAGQSGIYVRDLHEPALTTIRRIEISTTGSSSCVSLDANEHSIFAGYSRRGMLRYAMDSGSLISSMELPDLVASCMWTENGVQHLTISSSKTVDMWDTRTRDIVSLLFDADARFTSVRPLEDSQTFLLGSAAGCACIDIRNPLRPLWKIPSPAPVQYLSTSAANTIALFAASTTNTNTTVSTYNMDSYAAKPVFVGEHVMPFKVTAVGCGSGSASLPVGCAFAVKRPKRAGRESKGILCVGGAGFVDPPSGKGKSTSRQKGSNN